jgi:hypothetical protein
MAKNDSTPLNPVILKYNLSLQIEAIAGKLLAEGLTPETFTKAKAKARLKDTTLPVFCYMIVDKFTPELKKEMRTLKK